MIGQSTEMLPLEHDHVMKETLSASLALCEGNLHKRPGMGSFDVFIDAILRNLLNK